MMKYETKLWRSFRPRSLNHIEEIYIANKTIFSFTLQVQILTTNKNKTKHEQKKYNNLKSIT